MFLNILMYENQKLQQKKGQTNCSSRTCLYENGSYAISEIRSQDNKTDGLLV
jgi:hypothetical protein